MLDRTTGELISAEAYTAINWATGVDKATGRPIENPAVYYENQSSVVIPAQVGGHNWQPMAFNRDTGLVYIPTIDAAAIYVQDERVYKPGLWNTGLDFAKVTQSILDLVARGRRRRRRVASCAPGTRSRKRSVGRCRWRARGTAAS